MEKIMKYLAKNMEETEKVIRELISWNGSLDYLDFYENDEEFFNTFFVNPHDAIRAVMFGDYNYNDEYVRFDGYGNLDSFTEKEVQDEILYHLEDIAEVLVDEWHNIHIASEELDNLILEYVSENE
mgnify:CR=1 FL=1